MRDKFIASFATSSSYYSNTNVNLFEEVNLPTRYQPWNTYQLQQAERKYVIYPIKTTRANQLS